MNRIFSMFFGLAIGMICCDIRGAAENLGQASSSSSLSRISLSNDTHSSKKKLLTIKRELFVPGERGRAVVREQVDLSSQDHISKQTFHWHIKEDRKSGLPWILALLQYRQENGDLARDYADGRWWHNYLVSSKPTLHPLYRGDLVGAPDYYSVEVKNNKLVSEFLGSESEVAPAILESESEVASPTARGELLQLLLGFDQSPEVWVKIAACYGELNLLGKQMEWRQRAVRIFEKENKPCGKLWNLVGVSYSNVSDWSTAYTCFEKALKCLQVEGNPLIYVLTNLGCVCAEQGEINDACAYYSWAFAKNDSKDSDAAVGLFIAALSLYATDPEKCGYLELPDLHMAAQNLLALSDEHEACAVFSCRHAERYAAARQEAFRLLNEGDQDEQDPESHQEAARLLGRVDQAANSGFFSWIPRI